MGEGVDPHPDPGAAVPPADPDQAEQEDDQHLHRLELQEDAEVEDDDDADERLEDQQELPDRKSTRLNSSHLVISYAVFCLKKKKNNHQVTAPSRARHVTP